MLATLTIPRLLVSLAAAIFTAAVLLFVEHARLNEAKAKLESCRTQYAVAAVSIAAQNKAVQDLQAKADEAAARVKAAELQAAATAAKAEAIAAKYKAARVPTDCQGAAQWQAVEGKAIANKWGAK